jgi:predicted RNA binding protein YcfA (HicA-like mRNA interferase family)
VKAVSGKELGELLERHGWVLRRVHGSHHIYGMDGCVVRIPVPVHENHALKPGLRHHLLQAAGLDEEPER